MPSDAPNLNYFWAGLIVEELVRNGVRDFCISPGSRSTPLTLAAAANEGAEKLVHFDERGTVFHALGRARASAQPVAFICTSGTAVANAMPAVVEASMSGVPLILLTADRPPELLDTGANQTIDQTRFFGNYVRWFHALPCPDPRIPPETVLTAVDQAVHRARHAPAGPVHINCMFREPLAPRVEEWKSQTDTSRIDSWFETTKPYTQYATGAPKGMQSSPKAPRGGDTVRGLLVVGQLASRDEVALVELYARALGWPTLADATSGLRFGGCDAPIIHYYDQLLLSDEGDALKEAEVVLHVGGAVVSKRLLAFLENGPPQTYIRVADHPLRLDPAHRVTSRINAPLAIFAAATSGFGKRDAVWLKGLAKASRRIDKRVEAFMQSSDTLSEIAVLRMLTQHAPGDTTLFLGNSMPIRDADMYGSPTGNGVFVAANRGASGIDGNIATAAGHAAGSKQPVTAVIGDLAALHDLNSLALLEALPAPLVLVVINNGGGGIFSFLPVADYPDRFERYFGTPHGQSFQLFAESFALDYAKPDTQAGFVDAYLKAIRGSRSCIIEVFTDRAENFALHQQLQEQLRQGA